MYVPVNPDQMDNSWELFLESLIAKPGFSVVENGRSVLKKLQSKCLEDIVYRFKKSDYARIGMNRSVIEPIHFAINFKSTSTAAISELITANGNYLTINKGIMLATQFVFFENTGLESLIVPMIVNDLSDSVFAFDIDKEKGVTVIREK